MPDPYNFPPGDVRADDPVSPVAGPDGGEGGSNEHGAGSVGIQTSPGGAQGGGYTPTAPGILPDEDPEVAAGDVEEPVLASTYTPATVHVGTAVTVTGSNLGDVDPAAVTCGGVAATGVTSTATSLTFTVGVGTTNGAKAVVVGTKAHGTINGPAVTVS